MGLRVSKVSESDRDVRSRQMETYIAAHLQEQTIRTYSVTPSHREVQSTHRLASEGKASIDESLTNHGLRFSICANVSLNYLLNFQFAFINRCGVRYSEWTCICVERYTSCVQYRQLCQLTILAHLPALSVQPITRPKLRRRFHEPATRMPMHGGCKVIVVLTLSPAPRILRSCSSSSRDFRVAQDL